jgi:hypothetical protein
MADNPPALLKRLRWQILSLLINPMRLKSKIA